MADAPERLDLAEDPMGGWWSAADAPPEARVTYVLASIADEHKRQRDRLLETASAYIRALECDDAFQDMAGGAMIMYERFRAAIAACQEKGDPT